MGRITVFTTTNDLNSKQVLKELQRRRLPFEEIDVTRYPWKIKDLEALVGAPSVPHVFFNTRYVGGVDQCVKELEIWDSGNKRYASPLERFKTEIEKAHDPTNIHLALPTTRADHPRDQQQEDEQAKRSNAEVNDEPAKARQAKSFLSMPDGSLLSLRKVTETLQEIIPPKTCVYKSQRYTMSFAGHTLIYSLKKIYDMNDEEQAVEFAKLLSQQGIIRHVDPLQCPPFQKSSFVNSNRDVYRLQCYAEPDVLNSYLFWPKETALVAPSYALEVVENLDRLMSVMELSSIDPDDGLLDLGHLANLKKFALFQEAACELQNLSWRALMMLNEDETTAFALNLYSVMVRYASIKLGVPKSDNDRNALFQTAKFYLAGEIYTLQDWVNIVLAGSLGTKEGFFNRNNSSVGSSNMSHGEDSSSSSSSGNYLTLRQDYRIVFALFVGPHNGSKWSIPFSRFTAYNLDKELEMAAKVFCQDNGHIQINRKEGQIKLLSSVFKTHGKLFGSNERNAVDSILVHLSGTKRSELLALLRMDRPVKVLYMEPQYGQHTVSGPWFTRDTAANSSSGYDASKGLAPIAAVLSGGTGTQVRIKDSLTNRILLVKRRAGR